MPLGAPPFQGATFQIADQVLHNEPPHLKDVAPEVSRAIAEVCHAALAKDPQARPDAAAFAERLHAAVLAEEPEERPSAAKLALGVALLAALVALGSWGAFQLTSSEGPSREGAAPAESQPAPSASVPEAPPEPNLNALRERTHAAQPLDPALVEALGREMKNPEQAGAAALVLADYLLRRGDLTRAEKVLSQIPESAPESRRARLLETRVLFRLGRNEEGDALESDLLLENLEDGVGRVIRARRLMSWKQNEAGYELLRPLLAGDSPDRIAVDLAFVSNRLQPDAARELCKRVPIEGDPALLLQLSRLQRADDPSQADATLARAEALCAPRDCAAALLLKARPLMRANGTAGQGLLGLVQRCYAAEPSTMHTLLLLIYGKLPEDERQRVAARLRQQAPAQFAVYVRSQGPESPRALPPHQLATPFFPGDESWTWARERVAKLPERARRHGFRALTAAIGGSRDWSYVSRELNLATQADETKAARELAVEICVRRGRLAEALEFAESPEAIPPLLRARFELYRAHESSAMDAFREAGQPLALAEAEIAEGRPAEAARRLDELEPSVDVRLAQFEVAFALEQKKEAIEGNSMNWAQLGARAQRGADEVARRPVRESLAKVQAAIGCLDLRLGVAYELYDLRNRFSAGRRGRRGRGRWRRRRPPPDPSKQIGPREPLERTVYYSGDGDAPSVYFFRRALFYAVYQSDTQRNGSKMMWGPLLIPRQERLLQGKPSPALNLFMATLDLGRGQQRIATAREADSQVELPAHMAPLVKGRSDRDLFFPKK